MTEKDHYKYGLSGDKVPVELAEKFRAEIRALKADLASVKRDRDTLLEMTGTTIEQVAAKLAAQRTGDAK